MDTTVGEYVAEQTDSDLYDAWGQVSELWSVVSKVQGQSEDIQTLLNATQVFDISPFLVHQLIREANTKTKSILNTIERAKGEKEVWP